MQSKLINSVSQNNMSFVLGNLTLLKKGWINMLQKIIDFFIPPIVEPREFDLYAEMEDAKEEIKRLEANLGNVISREDIDLYVYKLSAARNRLSWLLNRARAEA